MSRRRVRIDGPFVDLRPGAGCHGHQDDRRDPIGVRLRVGETEGASPGDTDDHPPLDAEVASQLLDVGDGRLRGVGVQTPQVVCGAWRAAPAPALLQSDDEGLWRVDVAATAVAQGAAGSAVGNSAGSPSGLPDVPERVRSA